MGQFAGQNGELSPPGLERPQFVADLGACVSDWERALAGRTLPADASLFALTQSSSSLAQRSAAIGFGGIGHHLGQLVANALPGASVETLRGRLDVVRELLGQARTALTPNEAAWAANPGRRQPPPSAEAAASGLAPPPMITVAGARPREAGSPVLPPDLAPPKLLFQSQVVPKEAELPRAAAIAAPLAPLPAPALSPPPAPGVQQAPPPLGGPAEPLAPRPAPLHGLLDGSAGSGIRQPNLFVRSVLGLRVGRKGGSDLPALGGSGGSGSSASSLLGLKPGASAPAPAPPQLLNSFGGLPALRADPTPVPALRSSGFPRARGNDSARTSEPPPRAGRSRIRRPEHKETRWWVGVFAVAGVGLVIGLIVVIAVLLSRRGDTAGDPTTPATSASVASLAPSAGPTASAGSLPRSKLISDDERFISLLAQMHGRGKESGELRALVDEQAAVAAQALSDKCIGPQCAKLAEIKKIVTGKGPKRSVRPRSRSTDTLRSKWLAGLAMPEIHVEDDPRVQKQFEFYTENPVGRETFQQMLFRCGAFRDGIQSTLIRHGLPAALMAVSFAESSCYPLAKSQMGAEGLWQFIPEAARAYHLRIIPDVVDERHSPQKSTEAAVRFLSDLYAKFGDWDLVFAAYNMGPFGLMTRLNQVEGERVGFWELVDADLLPEETSNYAPAIQAIALILNNLQRLKFAGIQMRAPQVTMDLAVPPSTRLSLVARAAAMSFNDLRALNLDLKGTSTPGVPNFSVQVPKDSVWQARDTLQELLKSKDESDQCVPGNFDWGRQRFTPEMAKACNRTLTAAAAAAPAEASTP